MHGETSIKVQLFCEFALQISKIEHHTDHITLLTIILLITIIVDDVILAIRQRHSEVVELALVVGIGQNPVERNVRNRLLGCVRVALDNLHRLLQGCHVTILLLIVLILSREPLFIFHLQCVKEVW